MTQKKEIQVIEPQSVAEIQTGIQTIQKVMKSVMKKGIHYGVVSGCGTKPILLKPGAEKIMATFRIAPAYEVVDLSTEHEFRYRVTTTATSPNGNFLGQGLGECSSNEGKYKWREAICDKEFNETPENRRREKWKKGAPPYTVKQVREEPADKANTVLKMAKKRSCIDMVLTVTAASDIFAQDIEEDTPKEGAKTEAKTASPSESNKVCSVCQTVISQSAYEYSMNNYKKVLCFNHQKDFKNAR